MFNLFKKKTKSVEFVSPVDGQVIQITDINDDMFSQKMLGDGFAVKPSSNYIYAPVSGLITAVFSTKHAVGLKTEEGIEVLLHLGIDTVELAGKPFIIRLKMGQKIAAGDAIGTMNREEVEKAGKDYTVIVIFTNLKKDMHISKINEKNVVHGEAIGKIELPN